MPSAGDGGPPPTFELLASTARAVILSDSRDPVEVPAGIDSHRFIETARRHGVIPLVDRAVQAGYLDTPESFDTVLHGEAQRIARRSLKLSKVLRNLTEAFDDASIPFIVLKGPALATQAYGDPAGRQYSDLDLLVAPADRQPAERVLDAAGFRAEWDFDPWQDAALTKYGFESNHYRPADDAWIDLHWRPIDPYLPKPESTRSLIENRVTVTIGGNWVPTVAPGDALMFHLVHGLKHCWHRLEWVSDVAALVEEHDIDLVGLLRRARDRDLETIYLLGLGLAHDILQLNLPDGLENRLSSQPDLPELLDRSKRWLASDTYDEAEIPLSTTISYHQSALGTFRDRATHLFRLAAYPMGGDIDRLKLSPRLSRLYHLYRPIRLSTSAVRRGIGN